MQKLLTILFLSLAFLGIGQTGNFWTKLNDFGGLKRERAVAFTIGDKAYAGTGVDTAEIVHNDFWEYDPMTDAWTQVANLPASVRRNAIAFAINDKGYVGTGIDSSEASAFGSSTLSDFWSYDAALNTWTQKANFPGGNGNGIYFATAFSIGNFGYVCGGKRGPNQYVDDFWRYDPNLDQWTQLQDFPGGVRYQLCSFVSGNTAYVGLGTDQDLYRKDLWAYNDITDQWTPRNDFPASERASTMTFTIGQKGYICMGANGGILDDLWEYNPFADTWLSRATYGGSSRKNAISFSLLGKGYVGTGKGYSGKKSSMHVYTPIGFAGIDEHTVEVTIAPNPTTDWIQLTYDDPRIAHIELYSMDGKRLFSEKKVTKVDVSNYTSGTYMLLVKTSDHTLLSSQKIIVE